MQGYMHLNNLMELNSVFVPAHNFDMQGVVFMPQNPQQGFPPPASTIGKQILQLFHTFNSFIIVYVHVSIRLPTFVLFGNKSCTSL